MERILVVDSAAAAAAIVQALRAHGYEVVTAHNVPEALRALGEDVPVPPLVYPRLAEVKESVALTENLNWYQKFAQRHVRQPPRGRQRIPGA
jgi:DNA-binding NtrC family response regulator